MSTVSEHFNLRKTQSELDFVNVELDRDNPLFLDPYALSRRKDSWSHQAHNTLTLFFQRVIRAIRERDEDAGLELLAHLNEPNETRLGLSQGQPKGAGIGDEQAEDLYRALKSSSAVKTGLIESLGECELMIKGIGWDKISDLTTNVIRGHLIEYTQQQCHLHDIPLVSQPLPAVYDSESETWQQDYHDLPQTPTGPLVLVPKILVRFRPAHQAAKYYNDYVLVYLQGQEINAGTNLVRTLRSGAKRVTKKDLKAKYPMTKKMLFEFSAQHPGVLADYRRDLVAIERQGIEATVGPEDEITLAKALSAALKSIPAGTAGATKFQHLMMGILEFLFYPFLLHPRKEHEIHEGRKRIDIVFNNDASSGAFNWMHAKLNLPCPFVIFECKNYQHDIANPELDQLIGRFSPTRTKVGFVCCRTFDNAELFVQRCIDTYKDRHGLVVPMDDQLTLKLLDLVAINQRHKIDEELIKLCNSICFS